MTVAPFFEKIPVDLSPSDKFEYWRAATGSIFNSDLRPGDDLSSFEADLEAFHFQNFLIGASRSSPLLTSRSTSLVGQVGVDHLLIQLYASGEGQFEVDLGSGVVRPGDLVTFDLSRPHSAVLSTLSTISLVIPRPLLQLSPKALDRVHGKVIAGDTGLGRLLSQQIVALRQTAPDLTGDDVGAATMLASAFSTLALSASGRPVHDDRELPAAFSLQAIRQFIDGHVTDPNLSPEAICHHFEMSRATLYRIFEPLGGVANYIRDRRLDQVSYHLASVGTGRGAVASLTSLAGFSSEATFSRAFRNRFGSSPMEAVMRAHDKTGNSRLLPPKGGSGWLRDWVENLAVSKS